MGFAFTTVYQKIGLSYETSTSQPNPPPDKEAPFIPTASLYYSGSGWWPPPGLDFYSPIVFVFVQSGVSSFTFYTFSTTIEQTTRDSSLVNVAPTTVVFDGEDAFRGHVQIAYKPYVWESHSVSLYVSPDSDNASVIIGGPNQSGTFGYYDSDQTVTPVFKEGEPDSLIVTNASGNPVELTSAQVSDLEAAILSAVSEVPEPGNTNSGSIDWTFNSNDSGLTSLVPAGETVSVSVPIEVTELEKWTRSVFRHSPDGQGV